MVAALAIVHSRKRAQIHSADAVEKWVREDAVRALWKPHLRDPKTLHGTRRRIFSFQTRWVVEIEESMLDIIRRSPSCWVYAPTKHIHIQESFVFLERLHGGITVGYQKSSSRIE